MVKVAICDNKLILAAQTEALIQSIKSLYTATYILHI